jgi:glycosyltransferase involved in cell wall biosynthesis
MNSSPAPLRVAHVIWALGLGGAEQVVIRLAAGLDRTRFAPLVCCLDEPGAFAPQAERAGLEVVALGKRGPVDARIIGRLQGLLRRRRIDVVHTHLWGADLWGRFAARRAGTPVVVTTAHNVDSWKRWHHLALDRWLAAGTRLVAVSHEVRAFYEERGVGRGRWQVIYNGVGELPTSPRDRRPLSALGIAGQDPVAALVGRLVPAKAPGVFLEAVQRAALALPSLRAIVVGDGPLRPQLEQRARQLGLGGRVVFAGLRHDVADLLAGVDVLAFSSEREGLSMAMLEAMAAGVPVVATRVGGTPELIETGVTGILVPPGEPQALADGLLTVLRSPERSDSLRRAARELVRSRFSLRQMIEDYEAVYAGGSATARPLPAARGA